MEEGLSLFFSALMVGFWVLLLFSLGNQKAWPSSPDRESGVSFPPNSVPQRLTDGRFAVYTALG